MSKIVEKDSHSVKRDGKVHRVIKDQDGTTRETEVKPLTGRPVIDFLLSHVKFKIDPHKHSQFDLWGNYRQKVIDDTHYLTEADVNAVLDARRIAIEGRKRIADIENELEVLERVRLENAPKGQRRKLTVEEKKLIVEKKETKKRIDKVEWIAGKDMRMRGEPHSPIQDLSD